MYAIVETGGKQYRVEQGTKIKVESLPAEKGAEIRGKYGPVIGWDELRRIVAENRPRSHAYMPNGGYPEVRATLARRLCSACSPWLPGSHRATRWWYSSSQPWSSRWRPGC